MRMAQEIPYHEDGLIDWPRVAYHVPYSEEGIIDWSQVEYDLPAPASDESGEESEVEAAKLDFDRALPSNLHPYYHHRDDLDCVVVGHRCNCPRRQEIEELSSPARKRSKESAAAAFIAVDAFMTPPAHPQPIVAPAADIQTVDSFNPDLRVLGSLPPLGLVVSENLRAAIETLDGAADVPAPHRKKMQHRRQQRATEFG